jgi:lipid-binding SYLF domain-containing protein
MAIMWARYRTILAVYATAFADPAAGTFRPACAFLRVGTGLRRREKGIFQMHLIRQTTKFVAIAALCGAFFGAPAMASGRTDLLRDANRTVTALKHDPAFSVARDMLRNARAVYIVPKLVKGGFIFGAEGGDGVLLVRHGHGWGAPRFYGMGSASFGLQIGLQQAQLVFIINSERALRGIESGNVKLGAGAGLTVVNLSSGAEGATTLHGGDIVVWTSGSGAYAGLTFNGTVIKADTDENAEPTGPEAMALRHNLDSVW